MSIPLIPIPDEAVCQEASIFSTKTYIACGKHEPGIDAIETGGINDEVLRKPSKGLVGILLGDRG
jgi:hypothetical protein